MRLLGVVGTLLVVGTLPFLLVLSNGRSLTLDQDFYLSGFAEQGVKQTTGMTDEELATAAGQIIAYLQGGSPVSLVVEKEWGREPLFGPKEAGHMVDVQTLVWQVFTAQTVLAGLFGLGVVATVVEQARGRLRRLARRLVAGGAFTLLIFVGLLVAALLDFQTLFVDFHLLSFTNLGWILDPRTDYLIRLFPFGFWYNAALTLVGRTIVQGALLAVASAGYLYLTRRQGTAEWRVPTGPAVAAAD